MELNPADVYNMEIDNEKQATRTKMFLISIPFVLLLGTGLLAIFLVIHTWIPTLISGGLVILGWAATVALKLQSVRFRVRDGKVTVLYYPISPMTSNFKKIEIPVEQLSKYEITRSPGNRKELILYETVGGEEAAYPPVSLTVFGKTNILKLEEILNSLCS
ncbi:MAG: hypothetical protein PHY99_00920 [Bacteroidales bacterium]|nr:hypothetical protein [Bacteroidales bacterium]